MSAMVDSGMIAALGTILLCVGGVMAWWLARRRRALPAVGPNGRCRNCDPASTEVLRETPFRRLAMIADEPHKCLLLAECRRCKAPAVQYSVDIYDDYWVYWCPIDEGERAQLLSIERDSKHDEVALRLVISMMRERRVLRRHPDTGRDPRAGLTWFHGNSCILDGPPW